MNLRSSMTGLLLTGVTALAADAPLSAATAAGTAAAATPDASLAGAFIRLAGAFALVIALFIGLVWAWKRWGADAAVRGRSRRLHVLESRSIGNRQSVIVVGYENERLLLGSSPQGVCLLTRLPESLDETPESTPAAATGPRFVDALSAVLANRR